MYVYKVTVLCDLGKFTLSNKGIMVGSPLPPLCFIQVWEIIASCYKSCFEDFRRKNIVIVSFIKSAPKQLYYGEVLLSTLVCVPFQNLVNSGM